MSNAVPWLLVVVVACGSSVARVERGTTQELRAAPADAARPDEQSEEAPQVFASTSVRVRLAKTQAMEPSTLTAMAVRRKIETAYLADLESCAKRELVGAGLDHGDFPLQITVSQSGRTIAYRPRNLPQMRPCVDALVPDWRFPIPKSRSGTAMEARFELVFELLPAEPAGSGAS
ncbi:MAG: hypothetical protein AB7P03_08165 [Kofleriaceae bacterium]